MTVLFAPAGAGAQQLRTLVVPADTAVAIAARGAAQPRLAARPGPARHADAHRASRAAMFEPEATDPLTAAGPAVLPLIAASALAATLGGGGGTISNTATVAPTRTR